MILLSERLGYPIEIFRNPPSIAEYSVEWSEHCCYARSRNLLKLLPKRGKYPVLVGQDCGGFEIGDGLVVVFKMESHNHPSEVEPYQGAATGIGGIIRDILTVNTRPIALLDSLRFGSPTKERNRYLLGGVVSGISGYGNCVGIPTVGGEIYFSSCYEGNCLVNVMCVGVGKKDGLVTSAARGVGNSVIYVGADTGPDGIGGCSVLASQVFSEEGQERSTVQIGNPFLKKSLIEAFLEAVSTGAV
ncbi:MAG TPA: AIR synthase related protein, partial [Candidatus Nanoarchaeia archaeon]